MAIKISWTGWVFDNPQTSNSMIIPSVGIVWSTMSKELSAIKIINMPTYRQFISKRFKPAATDPAANSTVNKFAENFCLQ
ncbi:hypothetical protein LBU01_05960 [Lentilactobacillus buchneri]|nr:hypothetical protein LBU01_05960 [Lentilactobacillus buchneri]